MTLIPNTIVQNGAGFGKEGSVRVEVPEIEISIVQTPKTWRWLIRGSPKARAPAYLSNLR